MSNLGKIGRECILWLLAILIISPLLSLLLSADCSGLAQLFHPNTGTLLLRTFAVALATATLACLLGLFPGLAIGCGFVSYSRPMLMLLSIPLLLPPYVLAMVWLDVFAFLSEGPVPLTPGSGNGNILYGPVGLIFVQAMMWYPLPLLSAYVAARKMEANPELAALVYASPWRVLLGVVVPRAMPAILFGAGAVAILSWTSFAVPSLLQTNVYPIAIFTQFNAFHDIAGASAMALPYLALGFAAFVYLGKIASRADVRNSAARQTALPVTPALRALARGWTFLLVAMAIGAPLMGLMIRTQSPAIILAAFDTASQELLVSLVCAACAALASLLVAFIACLLRPGLLSPTLYAGAICVLAGGPLCGIGLIKMFNHPGVLGNIYDSPLMLVFAIFLRCYFFSELAIRAGLNAINPALVRAANIHGATPLRAFAAVLVPLLALPVFIGAACVLILGIAEADASLLVAPPGYTPLGVRIFSLLHYGPSDIVAGLGLLLVATICLLVTAILICSRLLKRVTS